MTLYCRKRSFIIDYQFISTVVVLITAAIDVYQPFFQYQPTKYPLSLPNYTRTILKNAEIINNEKNKNPTN